MRVRFEFFNREFYEIHDVESELKVFYMTSTLAEDMFALGRYVKEDL